MSKIKKISFIFFIGIMLGNVGIWSLPVLNASEINQGIDYDQVYIEAANMTQEEYDNFVAQVNEQYGIDFEAELQAEGISKERAVSIGAMIAALYKAWKTCGTVARGMGMPGCGTVITSGYKDIRMVYQRIYG